MNYLKYKLIAFLLLTASTSFAQVSDDRAVIEKELYKALLNNSSSRQCSTIDISLSMLVISFNRKGLVQQVSTFGLPDCIDSINFQTQVKERVNSLSLRAKAFRNRCIVSPLLYVSEKGSWNADELREKWSFIFLKEISQRISTELKFIIPVTVQVYETQL